MNLALKKAIADTGLKQFVIAKSAGLTETRLSKIVHGHNTPTEEEMVAIAATLRRTPQELFSGAAA